MILNGYASKPFGLFKGVFIVFQSQTLYVIYGVKLVTTSIMKLLLSLYAKSTHVY